MNLENRGVISLVTAWRYPQFEGGLESVLELRTQDRKIERAVKPARPFDSNGYTVIGELLSLLYPRNT